MLSAIIITKDEAFNIEGCIKSIKGFVDEIVLVDSYSKDNTVKIAKEYTNKIYLKKFQDDGAKQRNYALSKTKGDWILSIDADERVSKGLAKIIPHLIKNAKYKGYLIPRRNYINEKIWLHYGLFYPDYQLRLFQKKGTKFIHPLHTYPNTDEKYVKKIKHYLIHNSSHTKYASFLSTRELFSSRHNHIYIQAKALLNKKNFVFSCIQNLFLSSKYFISGYILGKGFLDGWNGFRAALIFSIIPILVIFYSVMLRLKTIK